MDTAAFGGILTWVPYVKHDARVSQGIRGLEPRFPQYEKVEVVLIHKNWTISSKLPLALKARQVQRS